jgi:hypothetical protein
MATVVIMTILLCIRRVRVFTFTAPSLPELQEKINEFAANKCCARSVKSIVIREGESQYYGYITWRGGFFEKIPTDIDDEYPF